MTYAHAPRMCARGTSVITTTVPVITTTVPVMTTAMVVSVMTTMMTVVPTSAPPEVDARAIAVIAGLIVPVRAPAGCPQPPAVPAMHFDDIGLGYRLAQRRDRCADRRCRCDAHASQECQAGHRRHPK